MRLRQSPWTRRRLDWDKEIPELRLLKTPPEQVSLWGRFPPGPRVSIVGTRSPSPEGESAAFELAKALAAAGVCVVSGGALGVDAAAHRGALAGGGATLVVAPLWLDSAYPKQHRVLFRDVLEAGGGYLSVSSEGQAPLNWVFFRRNEVLAAISDIVVLGDCPLKSGARNAMLHARRLGKPRFCLSGSFGKATSQGGLIESQQQGASYIADAGPLWSRLQQMSARGSSLFERVQARQRRDSEGEGTTETETASSQRTSPPCRPPMKPVSLPPECRGDGARVLAALGDAHGTVDEIVQQTGLDVAKIQHQIALLTLYGLVFQDESGVLRYQAQRDD